jgi:hypothetical protein
METDDSAISHGKHHMVDVLGSLYGVSSMFTVGQNNLTARARMSLVLKPHRTNFEILSRGMKRDWCAAESSDSP